jgi:hypothetical protein
VQALGGIGEEHEAELTEHGVKGAEVVKLSV